MSGTGDGPTKASTDDTSKADDQGQCRRLTATEKTWVANATDGEHGEPGSRWNAKTRRRTKAEEGSDQRDDVKVDPEERTEFADESLEAERFRRGSRFAGERWGDNGHGARTDDESGTAAKREKPLNGENPGRGSGMQ